MTAPIPLTAHEEMDLLDEIERALVRLTTAELAQRDAVVGPLTPPLSSTQKTVIPAQAGTHSNNEQSSRMLFTGYGSPPARG
ncbi:hypothetical protein [Massilia sp. S19_KUP03_FR1]|uniref:hypothetical protein n=1 Tax=Massilia sp. S19_KUP03_FR1 TaxID=3025503 RepID=UPI002FCCB896